MSMTHDRAKTLAIELSEITTSLVDLLSRSERALLKNSNFAIDWANASKPSFLNEDSAGNLDGTQFTRTQLANAIGAIDQFRKLLRNESTSQGDYVGVLNLLAAIPQG